MLLPNTTLFRLSKQHLLRSASTKTDLYKTVEIDITELVNQWLNGTYPNYGIALTNPDGMTLVQFRHE